MNPSRPAPEGTSSSRAYDYDVVLIYDGEGAEKRFADRFYEALARSGLRVLRDNGIVSRGRFGISAIQKAREQSRITMFILSKEFPSSLRLASELARILVCSRTFGLLVVPVFYDMDPSDIRDRTDSIAEYFASHEQLFIGETIGDEMMPDLVWWSKIERWRKIIGEFSDLMGFVFPSKTTDINESIIIQRFVDFIKDGLNREEISLWCGTECQLINSGLSKLPENMNFPVLRKLFLQDNYDLSDIPLSFFEFMPALQVLDMSRTSIKSLPPSISDLVELQKLLLRGCKLLMELPPEIQGLKNLEVFDLGGTELIYIPKEIEMLSKLEHLEVSLCACADEYISEIKENGEIIPRKTLSKLLNLKELSIFVDPDCDWWYTEVEAIIQDLFSLEKLETVKLYFPAVELLQKFLQLPWIEFQSLSNFRLIVGRHDQGIISRVPRDLQDSFETLEKCLKYVNGEGNTDGIGQALKHARALFLDRHWTIDRLSTFMGAEMDKLRFCLLVECNEMITVIDGSDLHLGGDNGDKVRGGKPILGLLQYLSIHYMKNLESILVGPLASGCLYHLQVLTLHTCPKLTIIFNVGFLSNLMNLKELIVEDCPKVESLVTVESSHLESGEEFLPSLEKLSLLHLPGLVSISSGLCLAPRLERMVVYNCPNLRSLSPMEMSSRGIKEIKGESEWWRESNQPDYFRHVFVPFRKDGLMNQLEEARNSHNSLSTIQNSGENQVPGVLMAEVAGAAAGIVSGVMSVKPVLWDPVKEVAEVGAAAGIVSGVMSLKPLLWDPIKEVSRDMGKIHSDFTNAMQKLLVKKEFHEKMLVLWTSTKRPSKIFNNWIQEVTKLEKDAEEVDAKYKRKRNKSKNLHYFTCSKLCEKMKNMLEVAVHLEGTQMGNILVRKEPDRVVEMKGVPSIKKFPTLSVPLEKILGLLTKRKIKGIGICGMMGTGKTTIMQNVNNHEKIAAMFDLVIWVNVSMEENKRNFSLEQMQQSIVQRLNLDVKGAKDDRVAERIRGELWDKKCLLLLDGVEEDFELNESGIDLNYGNGSKLVLTTRMGHVYDSIVDRVVRVGRLSDDEARDMFKKVLGQSKCNFWPVMAGVVKCCDNLPFRIKMIASAFRKKETEESWVQGYTKLTSFLEGDVAIQKDYKYLEFCCDDLEGAQKDCFLYCALYPEESDVDADRLLDCWAAEDLYGTNQVRDFGCHILDELKKVSLLEERVYGHVKMHKLIRKVALYKLTDYERKHLVKIGESVQDPPSVEDWNQKNRISLVDNKLTTLPKCPDCPMLSTLILQRNQSLNKIHNLFFENTGNLRVLDLGHTGITSLPSSIRKLKLLKVLYLNDCDCLMQLPSEIRELECLQVLDIRGSSVIANLIFGKLKQGPCTSLTNIEKLLNLKRLLVSLYNFGNANDAYISDYCDVISSQVSTTLEELVIDVNSYKQHCGKMINMVRDKVAATFTKLITLKFCFEDGIEDVIKVVADTPQTFYPLADNLKSFVEKIVDSASESFQLFIGCSMSSFPRIPKCDQYGRYLKYCHGRGCNPTTIGEVLAITDAFELVNHIDLEHVSEFGIESLYGVQGCLIEGCNSVTEIVDGNSIDCPLLPNLRRLYIKKLPKLGSICKGPVHPWSLSKLRTLLIDDCSSIEELLIEPASVAVLPNLRKLVLVNLPNLMRICTNMSPKWAALEKLKIQNCPRLTEFPFCKDNTEKLRKLTFHGMPNLEMICAYESFEWPALEKLKIFGCRSLTKLPFNKDNAKNLNFIEAEEKWWEALLWQDYAVKVRLQDCFLQPIDQDAAPHHRNWWPDQDAVPQH